MNVSLEGALTWDGFKRLYLSSSGLSCTTFSLYFDPLGMAVSQKYVRLDDVSIKQLECNSTKWLFVCKRINW